MRRFVIVGAGAAGISAAEAIRSRDPSAAIQLVCEEPAGYYSRPGLAYYLTGELVERQLFPFSEKDYRCLGLQLRCARVERIHPGSHRIELSDGAQLAYDRLLIATGSFAAPVWIEGGELQGVVKLDNLEDARQILGLARRARAAVVVGGGITALEIVEGLRARGVKVHYFLRRDRYWSNVLDETESRIVEGRLQEEGVSIHYHTDLDCILGTRGRVSRVRTKDGRQIPCDLVAIAIGVLPRKELAEAAGLAVEKGVLVDECLQTSAEDIFAAGDVAQVYDPFSGKAVVDTLWGPAREQGRAAGLNMAGARTVYTKAVPFNVTRLAGLTTTIIGRVGNGPDDDLLTIARGDSETWRQLPDAIAAQDDFEVNRLRVLVGQETFLGAVVMGDQTLSRPLHQLVANCVDITSIRSRLLAPNPPLADLVAEFYCRWKGARVEQHA